LNRLGIDIEGKRSDELLNMAREERNNPRTARPKTEWALDSRRFSEDFVG